MRAIELPSDLLARIEAKAGQSGQSAEQWCICWLEAALLADDEEDAAPPPADPDAN